MSQWSDTWAGRQAVVVNQGNALVGGACDTHAEGQGVSAERGASRQLVAQGGEPGRRRGAKHGADHV
jgi:hypothetical protein